MAQIHSTDQLVREFERYVSERIREMATEEMEKARERLKGRIPELGAEISIKLQSFLNAGDMTAVLQIMIKPKL